MKGTQLFTDLLSSFKTDGRKVAEENKMDCYDTEGWIKNGDAAYKTITMNPLSKRNLRRWTVSLS